VNVYEKHDIDTVLQKAKEIECIGYEIAPAITERYETALSSLNADRAAVVDVVVDTLEAGYVIQVCLLEINGEWNSISPTAIGLLGSGTAGPTLRYLRKIKQ